jgi:tetratricopeptide (TPR) repeat protein
MRICDLEARITANVKKKIVDFEPVKIAKGTIATPGLLEKEGKPILGKDKFQRITPEQVVADIHYVINQAAVRPTELNQQDFKDMRAYLKEAMKKESRKDIKGVAVSSYASPDGALDLNAKLSDNRGTTGSTALKTDFAKFDKAKDKSFYSVQATPEDWDGFKTEMEKSDLADKDLILRVLSMYSDPIVREAEVKKLSKAYVQVADKILPKLRRSVLKVNVEVMGWSDAELNQHFDNNPTILKIEEILFTATLTENLDRQLKIYNKASEMFPNDWRTFNNAGFVLVQMGKVGEAKEKFEKAKSIESTNSIIMNNLGVCALIEGDFVKGEQYFKSAGGAGKEVNYNLGVCAVKKADYSTAVTLFSDYCTFNAALAKLLNGDANNCVKTVDCAPDKDRAMMYYLKAVAGARQSNTDLIYNNLRAAISKDANLSQLAKTDMEFAKYFNDDTFKSIIK